MTSAPSPEHRVTIFKHGGVIKVWPPYLVVRAGDSVVVSTIGTSATLVFPYHKAFDKGKCDIDLIPNGQEAVFRVPLNKAERLVTQGTLADVGLSTLRATLGEVAVTPTNDQIYAYSVYSGESNDHGQGQSSPVIMIEPPEKDPPP